MSTIHEASWADTGLVVAGNHACGTQPGSGVTLVEVSGWVAWTNETGDFANAGVPYALYRYFGVRAVPHGDSAGRLNDNLTDPNLLITSTSLDVSQQPFWSDAPTSSGAWSHFTSKYNFAWRGARYWPNAMDWYVQLDYFGISSPTADSVTSGIVRFVWW